MKGLLSHIKEQSKVLHFLIIILMRLKIFLNINRSAGPIAVNGGILRGGSKRSNIWCIFNSLLIPKDWKIAYVIPIYKKGSKLFKKY